MRIALVLPAEGSQNSGNTMICEATERILKRVPFTNQVERFSYLCRPTSEELRRINGCDQAIFVGTNIFQSHALGWKWQPEDWRRIEIPYWFYGVGYSGSLQRDPQDICPQMRELISWTHGAEGLGVRDPQSVRWLGSFGRDTELIGCPVLAYANSFSKIASGEGQPVLAVRRLLLHNPSDEATTAQRMMIDWFFKEYPDGICVVQESADLELLEGRPVLTNLAEVIKALAQARVVLTARLHAGMIALSLGRPAVFLAHDTRVASFCEMIGLPSQELSFHGLKESIEAVRAIERGDLSEFREVVQQIPLFRQRLEQFLQELLTPLTSRSQLHWQRAARIPLQAQVQQALTETQALREQLQAKDGELSTLRQMLNEIHNSLSWKLVQKHWKFVNWLLPPRTRRRYFYDRGLRVVRIVLREGFGSLWQRIRSRLRARIGSDPSLGSETDILLLSPRPKRDKLGLMVVIPTMETGGMERCAEVLLKNFDRQTFELELAMLFDRKPFYQIPSDVMVHILQRYCQPQVQVNDTLARLFPEMLSQYTDELTWIDASAYNLALLIKKRQPDVILAQDFYASAIVLIAKQYLPPEVKIIGSLHIQYSHFLQTIQYGDLYAVMLRHYFNEADRIVTVSHGIAQDLIENFAIRPDKIAVIHNPLDLGQIERLAQEQITEHAWFNERVPILLFVGRLNPQKGLKYLLQATAVACKRERVRVVLIGEGEQRQDLEALAMQLGITEDVLFLGKQSNPFKFMHRATCFVLPSVVEGLPYVIPEAMACGCPVLATDCAPGVRELLAEGERGLLVPPKDPAALAEAMLKMLCNDDLRRECSQAGLQYVHQFAAEKVTARYVELMKI